MGTISLKISLSATSCGSCDKDQSGLICFSSWFFLTKLFSYVTARLVVFAGLLSMIHEVTPFMFFDTGRYFVPYLLNGLIESLTIWYGMH